MTTIQRRIGFSQDEEYVHTWSHLLGVAFIMVAGPILMLSWELSLWMYAGLFIYVLTFLGVFSASALYHHTVEKSKKDHFRKADHIAIYFFIAGSNTPYLLGFSDHGSATLFLALMWLMVLFGLVYKWFSFELPDWVSLLYYLIMGWLGVVTVYLISDHVDGYTFSLLLLGGILYTIGTFFYRRDFIKWYHTIWHILVLLAAITHYAALFYQLNLS